jgi:hypothetical protein
MPYLLRLFVLLLLMLVAKYASAQVTFDGCVDFRGLPVASVMNGLVQDVAMATYAQNGAPIIVYNPYVVSWMSPPTRLFFYAHECAHHVLAHGVRGHPLTREQEADCWSIQQLVANSLLSDSDLTTIQQDIAQFGQGDWSHLPGPVRAINLRACLGGLTQGAEDSDSGDACYDRCQATEDRCTSQCPDGSAWESCYDRCQRRFDSCTNQCQ